MYKSIDDRFEQAEKMLELQLESSQDSCSDEYMQGMYNGMAYMLSVFTQQDPQYIRLEEYKNVHKNQ